MSRPCSCDNVSGPVWTEEQCRRCWLWHYDPAYREHWGGGSVRSSCVHLGAATGETTPCPSCPGSMRIKILGCGVHAQCSVVKKVPGIACCGDCPDYQPRKSVKVNQGAAGLGDAILGLLAVGSLAKQEPQWDIEYRVCRACIPFVRMFDGGYMRVSEHVWDHHGHETPAEDMQLNRGYPGETASRCREPRWRRYCRNLGVTTPVLPTLRNREELKADGSQYAGSIVLAPFTSHQRERQYPLLAWLTLEKLLLGEGNRVIVTDYRLELCGHFLSEKVISNQARRVESLLLNASLVIANDSGIAHLAGVSGVPTVVLCGQTTGEPIYGQYPRMTYLNGHLACNGCWWQPPFQRPQCETFCASLASISPYEVLSAVRRLT